MKSDEQAIRDLIARWHEMTAAGNVDAILPLMSEDVIFPVPGKEPLRGRGEFVAGLRKLLESHRVDSKGEVQELQVSGSLAYAWTRLTVAITPRSGGPANVRSGSALTIFRKEPNGSWLLIRDANLLPPMK